MIIIIVIIIIIINNFINNSNPDKKDSQMWIIDLKKYITDDMDANYTLLLKILQ